MNENDLKQKATEKHIQIANEFVTTLIENFQPAEQNEAIFHVINRIREDQIGRHDEAAKQLEWLKTNVEKISSLKF